MEFVLDLQTLEVAEADDAPLLQSQISIGPDCESVQCSYWNCG